MELQSLPNELISIVISFLDGEDLLELSSVNQYFNELCDCHAVWYNILKQYKISKSSFYDFTLEDLNSTSMVSLKSLYMNVLCKWGWLVGTWKRNISAFGGMLFIKLEMSPCRIIGYDVQGMNLELNLVPMFEIHINKYDDGVLSENVNYISDDRISCTLYSLTQHDLAVECTDGNPDEIKISCLNDDSAMGHDKEQMISDFAHTLGMNNLEIVHAILDGFKNDGITFSRINVPLVSDDLKILEPGFFVGDYSVHGNEILLLKYGLNSILLEKVSGDRNVRCGTVSVDIDLTCPVDYSEVLKFMARQPYTFNIGNAVTRFQIKEKGWLEEQIKSKSCSHVNKRLVQLLKSKTVHVGRTFGIDENNCSYISAFKGKITLGMMPHAENPDYFYYEVLAIITNQDSLCVFWCPRGEQTTGIDNILENAYKRLRF